MKRNAAMTQSRDSSRRGKTLTATAGAKSWQWVRLGDHVAKVGSGFTPLGGHKVYQQTGVPLIRSQNVHMNRFEPDGLAFISPEQNGEMTASRVEADDVLLNITGASIGRVCVAPPEFCPANVNQHVCIIRSDGSFASEFLALYFASAAFQKFIMQAQAGGTRQALTKAMIENFRVPFAPLAEQRRIAARLREQMAEVERARAAVQAQLDAVQALPAAVLRAHFTTPAAQRWPRNRLGEVCELLSARSVASDGDTEVRATTSACLTETGFNPAGIKVARMYADDAKESQLTPGEILIARSNTPELVGRVAMFEGPADGVVASDLTIRLRPMDARSGHFFMRYLSFLYATGYWQEKASGASGTMKKITRAQLNALGVPNPPVIEQRALAARLTAELSAATALRTALQTRLAAIERLPAALLQGAFSPS